MRRKKKTAKHTRTSSYKKKLFPDEKNVEKDLLQVSHEALYSVTKPDKAKKIQKIITKHLNDIHKTPQDCVITDATACVGGDTLSFATYFKTVQSVELNPSHHKMLENNVRVYNRKNVNIFLGDYVKWMPMLQQDVVFIDPPWGGPMYKKRSNVKLELSNTPLCKIVSFLHNKTSMLVVKTPINFNIHSLFDCTALKTRKPLYNTIHVYHLVNMLIIVLMAKDIAKKS